MTAATTPTPDAQVTAFLSHLRSERGLAPNTVSAYRSDLAQLAGALWKRLVELNWARVTSRRLEDYTLALVDRGYGRASIARKVATTRSFFQFLAEEGVINRSPADRLRVSRAGRSLPDVLSERDVVAILEAISALLNFLGGTERFGFQTPFFIGNTRTYSSGSLEM